MLNVKYIRLQSVKLSHAVVIHNGLLLAGEALWMQSVTSAVLAPTPEQPVLESIRVTAARTMSHV